LEFSKKRKTGAEFSPEIMRRLFGSPEAAGSPWPLISLAGSAQLKAG
jgi:hypothetical protein